MDKTIKHIDDIKLTPKDWAGCIIVAAKSNSIVKTILIRLESQCKISFGAAFISRVSQFSSDLISWQSLMYRLFLFADTPDPKFWFEVSHLKLSGRDGMPTALLDLAKSTYLNANFDVYLADQDPEKVRESFKQFLNVKL